MGRGKERRRESIKGEVGKEEKWGATMGNRGDFVGSGGSRGAGGGGGRKRQNVAGARSLEGGAGMLRARVWGGRRCTSGAQESTEDAMGAGREAGERGGAGWMVGGGGAHREEDERGGGH